MRPLAMLLVGTAAIAALAACAGGAGLVERKDLTSRDVPIRFAYGGLGERQARYGGADDPRSGMSVRRVRYSAGEEFAIFDVIRALGDTGFLRASPSRHIDDFIRKEADVELGESGDVLGSARQTSYQAFTIRNAPRTACVSLRRSLREHNQAALGDYSQLLLIGVYCRRGDTPLPAEEIRAIAGALSA